MPKNGAVVTVTAVVTSEPPRIIVVPVKLKDEPRPPVRVTVTIGGRRR